MANNNIYKIPFRGLSLGNHSFDFVLKNDFFNEYEATENTVGCLYADVELNKSEALLSLKISIKGKVEAVCDRCLEQFELPVNAETELFIKFGDETQELAENLLVLSDKDDSIDLKDVFYELYMLNYPLRVIHPEVDGVSTCNKEMLERLGEYSVENESKTDPRWDELKKMINN